MKNWFNYDIQMNSLRIQYGPKYQQNYFLNITTISINRNNCKNTHKIIDGNHFSKVYRFSQKDE